MTLKLGALSGVSPSVATNRDAHARYREPAYSESGRAPSFKHFRIILKWGGGPTSHKPQAASLTAGPG